MVGGETVWSGHMATCPEGRERDRKSIGVDYAQAFNPHAVDASGDAS
jgi:hypothetical protein